MLWSVTFQKVCLITNDVAMSAPQLPLSISLAQEQHHRLGLLCGAYIRDSPKFTDSGPDSCDSPRLPAPVFTPCDRLYSCSLLNRRQQPALCVFNLVGRTDVYQTIFHLGNDDDVNVSYIL